MQPATATRTRRRWRSRVPRRTSPSTAASIGSPRCAARADAMALQVLELLSGHLRRSAVGRAEPLGSRCLGTRPAMSVVVNATRAESLFQRAGGRRGRCLRCRRVVELDDQPSIATLLQHDGAARRACGSHRAALRPFRLPFASDRNNGV